MEDLEEGDPEHRMGDLDRAPPPEPEGHGGGQELDGVLPLPGQQVPAGPEHEQGGEGVEAEIEDVPEAEEDRG